ncbi:MAG: alpha/beta fold hydrolase [Candidatus Hodarchaeales archaeon]|jgi:pimeloyl-ACP methyl ester carboxylesterase
MNGIAVIFWITITPLIVIVAIILYSQYKKKLVERILLLNEIQSQVYSSKYGNIEYLLRGAGPTILVSHGITGGIDQGIGMIDNILGSGYRFLYISRFGYLKSSIPDNPSVELQADVYKELLDHLGINNAFILGNSAGGTSVIQFAIRHPEKCKGLILISSNAPLDEDPGHPPKFIFKNDFLYWFFMKLLGKFMLSMFVPKSTLRTLSKERKKMIMEDIYFSALPVSKRKRGIIFDMYFSNPSINAEIPFESIKSPTLIINADDDPSTRIEGAINLRREIKTSTLVTFDSGGHLLLDCEEEVQKHIEDFITNNS